MGDAKELGAKGERLAASFLRRQGYRILQRNYTCQYGEIDLVARHGNQVVFVEVKTRSGTGFGGPAEAVTLDKQRQLIRVAENYRTEKSLSGVPCRFDVVSILIEEGRKPEFELYTSAFDFTGWRT